jgi:hypothetical protein
MPDLDPRLEAAARRRLTSFAEAIAVPPATDAPGRSDATGGSDTNEVTDLPLVRSDAHSPRRRLVLVGAAASVTVLAAAAGGLALARDDDRAGEDDRATTDSSVAGDPPAEDCTPRVADDGVIASGPTAAGGSGWEVQVFGEPPHVGTSVVVDGVPAGGMQHDLLSRATLVNHGAFSLNAGMSEQGGIVYGELPRETATVEVTTDQGDAVSACPVTVPTDDLVAWFGLALAPGVLPADARALDAQRRVLASGEFDFEPPPGLPDAEGPASVGTHMTADTALVDLPLGGTDIEVPPPPERMEIASGTAAGDTWRLTATESGVDLKLELPEGGSGIQLPNPDQLTTGADWYVQAAGGQLVVWGPVPPEVATVIIRLDDGTSIEVPTVDLPSDAPAAAFATAVPEGATPTAIEAYGPDGTPLLEGVDVAAQIAALAGEHSGTYVRAVPPG